MSDFKSLSDWIFGNLQKIFFPEEWIALDKELSKTELVTLFFVDRNGEIIMSRLAEYMGIPMSTATGIVDRLVKNGFIVRDRDEADRRIVTIRLTEKGKASLESVKTTVTGYIDIVRDVLTEEERKFLMATALKVFAAVGRTRETREVQGYGEQARKIEIE